MPTPSSSPIPGNSTVTPNKAGGSMTSTPPSLSSTTATSASPSTVSISTTSISSTTSATQLQIHIGDEVDYNCVDGYWLLSKIEYIDNYNPNIIYLRFNLGPHHIIRHKLDLSNSNDSKRITAACK